MFPQPRGYRPSSPTTAGAEFHPPGTVSTPGARLRVRQGMVQSGEVPSDKGISQEKDHFSSS